VKNDVRKDWQAAVKELQSYSPDELTAMCTVALNDCESFVTLVMTAAHSKKLSDFIYPKLGLGGSDHMMILYGQFSRLDERRRLAAK